MNLNCAQIDNLKLKIDKVLVVTSNVPNATIAIKHKLNFNQEFFLKLAQADFEIPLLQQTLKSAIAIHNYNAHSQILKSKLPFKTFI
jgi:hypothetical protein